MIMPYQPIEEAPKDGTEILCTWSYIHPQTGRRIWRDEYAVLAWFPDWHGNGIGAWVLNGDFSVRYMPSEFHETPPIEYGNPTHFMYIPRVEE